MLKNSRQVAIKLMICGIIFIISSMGYAKVINIPLELQCSANPMIAPWVVVKGKPKVQYAISTIGIREGDNVMEVNKVGDLSRATNGLHVYVEARCLSENNESDISLTGSSLICNIGDGLKIKVFEPNSINPNKYHYVGMIKISTDDGIIEDRAMNATAIIDDSKLPKLYTEFTAMKISESSY